MFGDGSSVPDETNAIIFFSVKLQKNVHKFTKSSHHHEPIINSSQPGPWRSCFFSCAGFNRVGHNSGWQLVTLGQLQKMVHLHWPKCVAWLHVPAFFNKLLTSVTIAISSLMISWPEYWSATVPNVHTGLIVIDSTLQFPNNHNNNSAKYNLTCPPPLTPAGIGFSRTVGPRVWC